MWDFRYNHPAASHYSHFIFLLHLFELAIVVLVLEGARSKMDVNALRDRIQSTLDANADTRRQAELDLKYVCLYLTIHIFHLLIIFFLCCRPRRNPDSQVLCWIFCRANKTMLFNFLVWKTPPFESLVYTVTVDTFSIMWIN